MTNETNHKSQKTYQPPEIEVTIIELGVSGQYGDPDDPPKPLPDFGFGNSAI